MIKYSIPEQNEPQVLKDKEMISVRTAKSGIFEALVKTGEAVDVGQPLANIMDPYEGRIWKPFILRCRAWYFSSTMNR